MDAFYARLFATAPSVEPLFAGSDLRRGRRRAPRGRLSGYGVGLSSASGVSASDASAAASTRRSALESART